MINRHTLSQFTRYAFVGLASNAAAYLVFLLLTYAGMGYKTAMTLIYLFVVVQTFYFNRAWSFRYNGGVSTAFVRYVLAYVLGYLLNLALLWLAVDRLGLPPQGVQLAAIFLVAICLFLLHKYWVFMPAVVGRRAA